MRKVKKGKKYPGKAVPGESTMQEMGHGKPPWMKKPRAKKKAK